MVWLETPRLILRDFQPKDSHQLAPILANAKVMKFSLTGVLSASQVRAKVDNFIASYKKFAFGKWAIIFKESNKLIGYCGIAIEQIDKADEPEIGYRLDPAFWGCGLATEAASTALQYGFERLNFPDILGIVERENVASVRVLKKLGMKYKKETVFHGVKMDIYQVSSPLNATLNAIATQRQEDG
jgi:RimJ/RimL family protein N-acetyltransferase